MARVLRLCSNMNDYQTNTARKTRSLAGKGPIEDARERTAADATPITTRSRVPLSSEARRRIEQRLRKVLAPFASRIERASIRFEDVNGPRRGVGLCCKIELVLNGAESIVVEQRATNVYETVRKAMPRVGRSIRRHADQSPRRTSRTTRSGRGAPRGTSTTVALPRADEGSFIGKRVGRGPANWAAVLERPEKLRRDIDVDTAQVGVSASDRRAGSSSTARRNSKRDQGGMTYALEDSRTRPSRKSTRGSSSSHIKAATQLTRRVRRQRSSSAARAAKGY